MAADRPVFQASDLAGSRRREFIGVARTGRALLRDTDGFALAMVPLAELEAVTEVARTAVALLQAEPALRRPQARPSDLGSMAWLAVFDEDDRAQFLEELRDAISLAGSSHDLDPLHTCLRDWQTTGRALSDPTRRKVLTGAGDDDYAEVGRPA